MNDVRRQRVANGSRRKRDLATTERDATAAEFNTFAAEHFPNESRHGVLMHAFHLWNENGRGPSLPSPAAVRARMEAA